MTSRIFFSAAMLAMLLTYNQNHHFQFLVCDSKTQQALNHDKYHSKMKQKITGEKKLFPPCKISSMDAFRYSLKFKWSSYAFGTVLIISYSFSYGSFLQILFSLLLSIHTNFYLKFNVYSKLEYFPNHK